MAAAFAYRRLHPARKRAGLDRLRDDPTVPLAVRELLELLLWKHHNGRTGTLNPHPRTLAAKLGRSERQVRRLIAAAERRGLLEHRSTGPRYRWGRWQPAGHRYRPGPAFLALCERPGWDPTAAAPRDTRVPRSARATPPRSAEIHQLQQGLKAEKRREQSDMGVPQGIHEPDSLPVRRDGPSQAPGPAGAEPVPAAAAVPRPAAPAPAGAAAKACEEEDDRAALPVLTRAETAALVAAEPGWCARPGAVVTRDGRRAVVPAYDAAADTETEPRARVWIERTTAQLARASPRERAGYLPYVRRVFAGAEAELARRPRELAAALYLCQRRAERAAGPEPAAAAPGAAALEERRARAGGLSVAAGQR